MGKRTKILVSLGMAVVVTVTLLGCSDRNHSSSGETINAAPENTSPASKSHHPLPPEPLGKSYLDVKIIESSGSIRNVFVSGEKITHFTHPQHIYAAKVSPDNRYLMVWHMDYTPRKLSVYDLEEDNRKICTFVPGAGGDIRWAAHDLLYHQYGAGTNTAIWAVYDVNGNALWRGYTTGAALCESGRYVFLSPSMPAETHIQVRDVRDGHLLADQEVKNIQLTRHLRWIDGQTLRAWYQDLQGQTLSIDIPVNRK